MSNEFKREERYIVVKIKDAQAVASDKGVTGQDAIRDLLKQWNIPIREGLVIEKDWPEYEPTWQAIERRMTGTVQWDGKGLPPVGAVVEYTGYSHNLRPGDTVEIIHHFNAGVCEVAAFVYLIDGYGKYVGQSTAGAFRPVTDAAEPERQDHSAELLAVLEVALRDLERMKFKIEGEFGTCRSLEEIEEDGDLPESIIMTRAAIAKAKGGAT